MESSSSGDAGQRATGRQQVPAAHPPASYLRGVTVAVVGEGLAGAWAAELLWALGAGVTLVLPEDAGLSDADGVGHHRISAALLARHASRRVRSAEAAIGVLASF